MRLGRCGGECICTCCEVRKEGAGPDRYLGVGRGFQEAEAVSEALAGQAELDLLLQHRRSALQHHLVFLQTRPETRVSQRHVHRHAQIYVNQSEPRSETRVSQRHAQRHINQSETRPETLQSETPRDITYHHVMTRKNHLAQQYSSFSSD